jgi:putative peptide zinc metalloprotease protein
MNDAPLQSQLWYRVSSLRPRLLSRARLHRHRYRGQVWYLLQDPASSRVHRFTPAARLVIAAMDGQRTMQELWALASDRLGDEAPTQDELLQLLGQLHAADLLGTDVPPDALELTERSQREAGAQRRRSWINPMALRIPLWDPGRFLDRHEQLWRRLWSPGAALLWLAVVLPALVLLPAHWADLTGDLSDRVLQADNLVLMALLFPLIKAAHELGHATATRAGGGEVHDMGVMVLVLMPVPYVDASAANVLRSRWQRALVGAAGMLVELFIAALAFYAWLLVEPGIARAVCFNLMFVAGVSTIIFNGNPLLRYDAYYILADLIELPNLAAQSARYWGYLLQRHLLRMHDPSSPAQTPSEAWWFAGYGLASATYRLFVTFAIALFVGTRFFFVGIVLAIWGVMMMSVVPLAQGLKALSGQSETRERPWRVYGTVAALATAVLLLVTLVPFPYRTQADGVVWMPERAIVRAGAPGFFRAFDVAPGSQVQAGAPLLHCLDPALTAQVQFERARVDELQASFAAAFVNDRARAEIVREDLDHEQAALARAQERAAGLVVAAGSTGRFVVPQADDLPGRYLQQGQVIGYVLGAAAPTVRVVLDQNAIEAVTSSTRGVEIRLDGDLGRPLAGRVARQVPAGRDELPSLALTPSGGGRIAVDPRDPKGLRTLERVFELDVAFVAPPAHPPPYGQRVHVRFDHAPEPLATQVGRALRRLLLRHFDV